MGDLRHHATHLRAVDKGPPLMHLVEAEPDQCRALDRRAPDRASDLLDDDGFSLLGHCQTFSCSRAFKAYASVPAASPAPSLRRETISLTFLPRRAATPRGLSSCRSASKVARTML